MSDDEPDAGLPARAFPIVLAGPSGSGKTTVARALVRRHGNVRFSVSATTREERLEETDGEDYHFLDREAFRRLREEGRLLEWAEVHGEWYGTPRANLEEAREEGDHLLLDVDVQGARSVRENVPDAVTIFLLTSDGGRIVRRLRGRGTEDEEQVRRRLQTALTELEAVGEFDYAVVNDELERAVETVEAIIWAEEHRIERLGAGVRQRAAELAEEIRAGLDPRQEETTR